MDNIIVLDKTGLGHLWERIKQLVEKMVGGGRTISGRQYLSVGKQCKSVCIFWRYMGSLGKRSGAGGGQCVKQ